MLTRNVQPPEQELGFPKWSMPAYMNCTCPNPCSFIGYTMELKNLEEYEIDISIDIVICYVMTGDTSGSFLNISYA